jgi:hypothetical protein
VTHTYDDLDDLRRLDKVWYEEGELEVDLEALDADDEVDELDAIDQVYEVDEDGSPLGRRAWSRSGRVARRRTTTLLNASTVTILVGFAVGTIAVSAVILAGQFLTTRQLFFLTHSTLGIIIVHAFGGGLGTLCTVHDSPLKEVVRKLSTVSMAVVAWLTSAIGTWFGYAGYRAPLPPGGDIEMYPRAYLLSSPRLAFWETFAMEWKVHIGWLTPFLASAVAFVALRYGRRLVADIQVRKMLTNLFIIAFATALVAAGLGALVNVTAPNDFMHRGWHP